MKALTLALLLLAACGGESGELGLLEPFQVRGGAFKEGALPGDAPDSEAEQDTLRLTTIETNNTVVHPGQTGKLVSGRATDRGYAVALRFEGLGSGYWVKPLGEADSAYPGELDFAVEMELAADLPLGPRRLLFSVIDSRGRAGRQQALNLCATSRFDRALHACDDTQRPPAAIITLTWNTASDLDLSVRTPDGELIDARRPSSDPGDDVDYRGILYTDDAPGCEVASARREDLVFAAEVPPGRYDIAVNLFDACGIAATYFEVRAYARSQRDDGGYDFAPLDEPVLGQLLELQANAGSAQGLSITSVEIP
ncbi:MAG: hypothetical protein ABW321_12490 [Polyangiales bacterium]